MKKMNSLSVRILGGLCLCMLALVMVLNLGVVPAMAACSTQPRVVDEGNLLTDSEIEALEYDLKTISEDLNMDVAVVTLETLGDKTSMEAADDFYDEHGYSEDGCIFLVCLEERDYWLSTSGDMIPILTDRKIESIGDQVREYLSDGNYAEGFHEYGDMVELAVNSYIAEQNRGFFRPVRVLISFIISAIISFLIMLGYKSQVHNVKSQSGAGAYLDRDSVNIYHRQDRFLYTQVTHTPKPQENRSSGGGSSTHVSSSGHTHGGGGGKF